MHMFILKSLSITQSSIYNVLHLNTPKKRQFDVQTAVKCTTKFTYFGTSGCQVRTTISPGKLPVGTVATGYVFSLKHYINKLKKFGGFIRNTLYSNTSSYNVTPSNVFTEDVVQDMQLRNFLMDSYTKTSFVLRYVYQYSFPYKKNFKLSPSMFCP